MSHGMRSIELDGSQDDNGIQADPFISGLAYWFGDSGGLHWVLGTQEKVRLG